MLSRWSMYLSRLRWPPCSAISGFLLRVDQITLRSTRIITRDGKMLAVPSSEIINKTVASYTNFITVDRVQLTDALRPQKKLIMDALHPQKNKENSK